MTALRQRKMEAAGGKATLGRMVGEWADSLGYAISGKDPTKRSMTTKRDLDTIRARVRKEAKSN